MGEGFGAALEFLFLFGGDDELLAFELLFKSGHPGGEFGGCGFAHNVYAKTTRYGGASR